MKNSYKALAFALLANFLFAHCSADQQRNRDIPYNNLETVMANLSPLSQSFEIDPTEDNQIKGEKGTVVFIPADVFQFDDGSVPTGDVQVELKESYTLTEMIGAGLHTMSGDRPLETAGMIYVNATADGKPLKVQDGKAFVVSFPKNQQTEEMNLFYSLALKDSLETWVPDYEVFGVEKRLEAMKDTSSINSQDDTFGSQITYAIEMTPDLYDSKIDVFGYTATLSDLMLKGENKRFFDYLEDIKNIDTTNFCKVDCYAALEFKIDKNGKMNSFRIEKNPLNNHIEPYCSKKNLDAGISILKSVPLFDLKAYKQEKFNNDWYYYLGFYCSKQLNQDRYKQKFRNQYAEYQNKAIEKMDKAALNYYTFSVTKFGWINCDRFLEMDASELTNFAVNTKSTNNASVRLIFKDLNSIMEGDYQDGKIVFNNIPKGKAVKLVGISYADGKPTMATAETVVGEKGFELTGYKPFTLDEMEAALNN